MEIQWHERDPETGDRRYYHASRFAGVWSFKSRAHRRDDWTKSYSPTRAMWEHVLKALELRLPRREGVMDEDVAQVAKILKEIVRIEELRKG
jgi:hypothetical protein